MTIIEHILKDLKPDGVFYYYHQTT